MKRIFLTLTCCMAVFMLHAQKKYELLSPDGKISTAIEVGNEVTYSILVDGKQVLAPSAISLKTNNGQQWGIKAKVKKARNSSINETIPSPLTRQAEMENRCNVLSLTFSGNYGIEFRAYNNGVAYRFVNYGKKTFEILQEGVRYELPYNPMCIVPYVRDFNEKNPNKQFYNSFENYYTHTTLNKLDERRYCFLPLLVEAADGVKLCITESHLENYPGLYLKANGTGFEGLHAPHPKELKQGGHNNLQMEVQTTENFIAKIEGERTLPWRIVMISRNDIELAQNNLSYLLGAPCRLDDTSWIKPGKVAWDWWNDWNISGVDFIAGINNDTYKYYIDFASKKGIEYVILDEGWAVNRKADLMQVIPEIDLKELVDYGKERNVGIILWAGYWAFDRDMENVCRHYSQMGVKGFKVDFMDRDDQPMTEFYYRTARTAAKYKLLIDFHGAFKPAGLNRTYPNVVNFEGVNGLEQLKWADTSVDQVTYDTQIPFIRQAAGPMDYTQGAMLNAVKGRYRPVYSEPMSQGTRCHQLGLYMILESPLSMLCDSPTNYLELGGPCTDFIAQVPTVWDETVVLMGKIGEYIVTARRSGETWYIGGITNWNARNVEIPTAFLGQGNWKMISFVDGKNAHRRASDYAYRTDGTLKAGETLKLHMAPGGGFAIKLQK